MRKIFRVAGMHCSNCAMRIEELEDELAGVESVSASYQKGQVVVEFDEARVTVEEIIAAVGGLGYTAMLA